MRIAALTGSALIMAAAVWAIREEGDTRTPSAAGPLLLITGFTALIASAHFL